MVADFEAQKECCSTKRSCLKICHHHPMSDSYLQSPARKTVSRVAAHQMLTLPAAMSGGNPKPGCRVICIEKAKDFYWVPNFGGHSHMIAK